MAARERTAAGRASSASSRRGCRAAAAASEDAAAVLRRSRRSSRLTETHLIYATSASIQMGHAAACTWWLVRNLGQNLPPLGEISRPNLLRAEADNASISLSFSSPLEIQLFACQVFLDRRSILSCQKGPSRNPPSTGIAADRESATGLNLSRARHNMVTGAMSQGCRFKATLNLVLMKNELNSKYHTINISLV